MTVAVAEKDLTQEPVLEIVRTFSAPIEKVFEAFTTPDIVKQWWGPASMETTVAEFDLRPGGKWRTVMVNSDGDAFDVAGVYTEIDVPNRLVYTWAWLEGDTRGQETIVELTFTKKGERTELHLRQGSFVDGCAAHYEGWTGGLDNLEKLFA